MQAEAEAEAEAETEAEQAAEPEMAMPPPRQRQQQRRRGRGDIARLTPAQILQGAAGAPRVRTLADFRALRPAEPPASAPGGLVRELDLWPAAAGAQTAAPRPPAAAAAPRAAVAATDALAARASAAQAGEPALLSQLQAQLLAELDALPPPAPELPPGCDDKRLRAYGKCWDRLAEEFRLYRPLLTSIKHEYERYIAHYRHEVEAMQPELQSIEALEAERTRAVQQARDDCADRAARMRRELADAEEARRQAESDSAQAARELEEVVGDIEMAQVDLNNLHRINVSLVETIERYEAELVTQGQLEVDERRNMHVYEQECQVLLQEFHVVSEEQKAAAMQLEQVQDDLRVRRTEVSSLERRCKGLQSDLKKSKEQHRKARDAYRDVRRKFGSMQRLLSSASGRPPTPRPDWGEVKQQAELKALNLEQPSAMIVQEICEAVETLRDDLEKARDQLPWVQAEKKEQAAMAGKWFVCRGTSPNVPKFLRYQGKVRNRNMQKGDCEALIKGFWEFKAKQDAKSKTPSAEPVADRLYDYMQSKYGVQQVIVEMGYNLVDALKRYQYDADCELFHKILFGELCEDTYHDQERRLEEFMKACQIMDKKTHGGKKKTGSLTRENLNSLLASHFKFKTDEDLRSLRAGLQYDQPLPTVYYEKLFEETRDGDQGKFAETLRDQHLYDVMSTYPAIEDAIRRAVHVEKGGAHAVLAQGKKFNAATDDDVSVETNVAVVRKGLYEYDTGLPNAMINKILATGLGLPLSEAPFSDYRAVQVEDFVQRLRAIIIPRYSKPKAESEAEIEEKFMRSLPESERKAIERCFNEMDADFSGTLSADELHEMLKRTYGLDPSPDELAQLIAVCDKSGDGACALTKDPSTHLACPCGALKRFAWCLCACVRAHAILHCRFNRAGRVYDCDGYIRRAQDGWRYIQVALHFRSF